MMKAGALRSIAVAALLLFTVSCSGESNKPKEQLLSEGIKMVEDDNARGAVVLFKNAIEKDPNYFEARLQLAKAYYKLRNIESAEKEIQKVIRQNPSLKEAHIELARISLQKREPEKGP